MKIKREGKCHKKEKKKKKGDLEKENMWDSDDGMELDEDQEVDDQPWEFMTVAQECEEKTEDVIVPICTEFLQELQSQKNIAEY